MEHHMNRTRMFIEDLAFTALEIIAAGLCVWCISVWWTITP